MLKNNNLVGFNTNYTILEAPIPYAQWSALDSNLITKNASNVVTELAPKYGNISLTGTTTGDYFKKYYDNTVVAGNSLKNTIRFDGQTTNGGRLTSNSSLGSNEGTDYTFVVAIRHNTAYSLNMNRYLLSLRSTVSGKQGTGLYLEVRAVNTDNNFSYKISGEDTVIVKSPRTNITRFREYILTVRVKKGEYLSLRDYFVANRDIQSAQESLVGKNLDYYTTRIALGCLVAAADGVPTNSTYSNSALCEVMFWKTVLSDSQIINVEKNIIKSWNFGQN